MKNAPVIEMTEAEAKVLYQEYADEIKERGDKAEKYLKELKQTYYHLSQGRKVIDIYEVFKTSGLKDTGEPNLAIARADLKKVYFHKEAMGAGCFSEKEGTWQTPADSVRLPSSTFANWTTIPAPTEWDKERVEIENPTLVSKVPLVPAHIMPSGTLDNYYILFEVTEWNTVPVAADPYLLKRINANAFVVLAEWDITPIEQAIMRA